ncbi:MAG: insulinase family protein [Chlorobiales bacterium]|jgi:predicted Zn-dependent peptidase|nr:insulinase family protein [Chlorobiales bacterium]
MKHRDPVLQTDNDITASSYQKTVLPNGLGIVTETVPSVRSISVGLWTETGSRDEAVRTSGISHFIEHVVFKGTKKRNYIQISESLERVGGYLNAFTTKEQTCFYARCLDEHLKTTIDVLSDLAFNPIFPEEELEKEKEVIIEEIKSIDDAPDDLIFDLFDTRVFGKHSLSMPITGTVKTVRKFTREDVLEYLKQQYTPSNMLLIATGQVKHDEVVKLAEKFIPKQKPKAKSTRQTYETGAYRPFTLEVQKPITQSHIVVGLPFERDDSMYFPMLLLNALLGGGMSSRLNLELREKHGLAYTIYSSFNTFDEVSQFIVYAGTDVEKNNKVLKLIGEELQKVCETAVPKKELDLVKAQLKGGIIMGQESMSARMNHIARDEYYFGREFSCDEIIDKIDSITVKDIRAVAERVLVPSKLSTLTFVPKKRRK